MDYPKTYQDTVIDRNTVSVAQRKHNIINISKNTRGVIKYLVRTNVNTPIITLPNFK